MRRRDFGKAIVSMAIWPLAARAQKPERMRRVGALMAYPALHTQPLTRDDRACPPALRKSPCAEMHSSGVRGLLVYLRRALLQPTRRDQRPAIVNPAVLMAVFGFLAGRKIPAWNQATGRPLGCWPAEGTRTRVNSLDFSARS